MCKSASLPDMFDARKWFATHPQTQVIATTIYYLAIITALFVMYGRGNFETPEFVYQEF
jgi:hypothetical protein